MLFEGGASAPADGVRPRGNELDVPTVRTKRCAATDGRSWALTVAVPAADLLSLPPSDARERIGSADLVFAIDPYARLVAILRGASLLDSPRRFDAVPIDFAVIALSDAEAEIPPLRRILAAPRPDTPWRDYPDTRICGLSTTRIFRSKRKP